LLLFQDTNGKFRRNLLLPNRALPPQGKTRRESKLDGMSPPKREAWRASWVRYAMLVVGFRFVIQFLVPITLILINLVISIKLFRFVYIDDYQYCGAPCSTLRLSVGRQRRL
jgi:hypothetical protein